VERAMSGMTLDVLEQKRGRLLAADEIRDRCRFEIGIDFRGDALEFTERLDLLQPSIEVARVGAASDPFGSWFRALWFAFGRATRDAHVQTRPPSCSVAERPKSSALWGAADMGRRDGAPAGNERAQQ